MKFWVPKATTRRTKNRKSIYLQRKEEIWGRTGQKSVALYSKLLYTIKLLPHTGVNSEKNLHVTINYSLHFYLQNLGTTEWSFKKELF